MTTFKELHTNLNEAYSKLSRVDISELSKEEKEYAVGLIQLARGLSNDFEEKQDEIEYLLEETT